jgi:hypothetical protein
MKELSIEEKAKAYDEALERARDVYTYYCDDREQLRKIESIFPELTESEDERIRRWIINYLENKALNSGIIEEKTNIKNAIAWLEKQGEQKSAWSEEDEKMLESCIGAIGAADYYTFDDKMEMEKWLKSLKYRVQPKQEWSEEDESNLDLAIYHIRREPYRESDVEPIVDWLKSLRPQKQWKPSEEQLNNILDVLSFDNCTPKRRELLESLYQQLKKL